MVHSIPNTRIRPRGVKAADKAARKMFPGASCALARIGYCRGPIHVHHINRNPLDNSLTNLIPLCHSHHFLVHSGSVLLSDPVMPEFWMDAKGKRRYKEPIRKAEKLRHRKR